MYLLSGLPMKTCSGCVLSTNSQCGIFTEVVGMGTSGVMIVGEASGETEAQEGRPFVEHAPAGSILEKAIRLGGWKRDEFIVTNLVRCRPPYNKLEKAAYEKEAIERCRSNLDAVVAKYQPKAILALGSLATKYLTGFYSEKPGDKKGISYARGYVLNSIYNIPCVPSYHPAFIVRGNTRLVSLLIKDISVAKLAAQGKVKPVGAPAGEVEVRSGYEALLNLYDIVKEDPDLWICYDIETDESLKGEEDEIIERIYTKNSVYTAEGDGVYYSHDPDEDIDDPLDVEDTPDAPSRVLSIQFAISDKWGVFGHWKDPKVRDIASWILALPNAKVGHNSEMFDRPILEHEGITINGPQHDSLIMRRTLQPDLPAGLQQVAVDYKWGYPWKHYAGTNEELYGVIDVCSLVRIVSKIPQELDRLDMWDVYERYIREFREKVQIPWEKRGIPISIERLDECRDYLSEEVISKMNEIIEIVPPGFNKRHPEKGYKNLPPSIKDFVFERHPHLFDPEPSFDKDGFPKLNKDGTIKMKKSSNTVSAVYNMLLNGDLGETLELVLEKYPELRFDPLANVLYEFVPFNPRSSQQMIAYIKHKGYEVPVTFKDKKESTADKLMKKLEKITGDRVISLSRETRALQKMRDAYTGKKQDDGSVKGGWQPASDNRLHPAILTQSTWQMSSRGVNVMTMPVRREELAEKFRRCVKAEPGHVLIEADMKAFHAKMTGREALDLDYMRLSGLDIHSYVTGYMVKWPGIQTCLSMPDDDLKMFLEEIKAKHKPVRNMQAKPAILGIGFGMSYRRLFFENDEYFKDAREAKRLLDLIKSIFPKVFRWQEQILELADQQKYIQSLWGARRWFWDIYTWKKDWRGEWAKAKGQDAEKAIAYLPSNHSHGMLRKKIFEMEEQGLLDKYQLINVIHDAVLFHCPEIYVDEAIANIKAILESPVVELSNSVVCPDGFTCEAEISIGPDWAKKSMREVKI